jgi:hypothetical protein
LVESCTAATLIGQPVIWNHEFAKHTIH